jgi:hypothetical protein
VTLSPIHSHSSTPTSQHNPNSTSATKLRNGILLQRTINLTFHIGDSRKSVEVGVFHDLSNYWSTSLDLSDQKKVILLADFDSEVKLECRRVRSDCET